MKARNTPCQFCPYRRDVPSGVWHESEYDKLIEYDTPTGEQPVNLFACHAQPDCACAGWLEVGKNQTHDKDLLAVRLAVVFGTLEGLDEFECDTDMFATGTEAAEHGMRDIEDPSPEAQDAIAKLGRMITKRKQP